MIDDEVLLKCAITGEESLQSRYAFLSLQELILYVLPLLLRNSESKLQKRVHVLKVCFKQGLIHGFFCKGLIQQRL